MAWAYAREKVHLANTPGMGEIGRFAARGFPKLASSERIGAAVGSSMDLGFEAPADAYAVMFAVEAQGAASAIRQFALIGAGARPDWTPKPRITVQRLGMTYVPHVDAKNRRRLYQFFPFIYRGDLAETVAERRREYERWALGVHAVHRALSAPDRLVAYSLTPELPPLAPWA